MRAGDETCVVVGAGPVGLVAALELRRRDIPVVVVEAEPEGRTRPGSRAIFLFDPTLGRLNKVLPGLGKEIGKAGLRVQGYDTFYDGRRVFHHRINPDSWTRFRAPYYWGTSLPQTVTETILLREAVRLGVEFRWGSPVTGLAADGDGVTIQLASGEEMATRYAIGADGARSVVRKSIGASMEGNTDETPFIIVDVDEHPDGSTPKMSAAFHYRSPELDGRNVFHMPFASGLRIDVQCLPTDNAEYLASPQGAREWIGKIVDPWYGEHIRWVSTYLFHQVVADAYTDPERRVLLAGEAAHLFAPFGARGLNSGVFDATDAAAAIAGALSAPNEASAHGLVERCATNRRTWGLRNRDVSSRALRVMRGTDEAMSARRERAARLAPAFWPAGAWLANAPLQVSRPRLRPSGLY
jgi:3-(3-hydroxy-phenyl)propionate hydroxylase